MKKSLTAISLTLLLLTACTIAPTPYPPIPPSPPPGPYEPDTFTSPLAHVYLPDIRGGAGTPVPIVSTIYKGLGVSGEAGDCRDPAQVGAAWWHNWFPVPFGPECSPGFVPTIGRAWLVCADVATEGGPLFTFNEPDQESQANLTPEAAAALWAQLEECYPDHDLIGPTVSQLDYGWIDEFYAAYQAQWGRPPRLWALSLNCYLPVAQCQAAVVEMMHKARRWGLPGGVWLKEINCPLAEMAGLINWLELMGVHYAWFLGRAPDVDDPLYRRPLLEGDGTLTAAGEVYRALPDVTPGPGPVPWTAVP